ncbi:MAG: hypothetical protein ACK5WH_10920 [Hyphomonadaceae bacterium]|jgi:hypothetical protein
MIKRSRSTTQIRDILHLAHCSPEVAASWLATEPVKYSTVFGTPETPEDRHLLEYILFRRVDPVIDLALATHGRSRTVLSKLYDRAAPALKAVLAANGSLFVGSDHGTRTPLRDRDPNQSRIWNIVRHAPLSELRALCSNPDISSGFYHALVTSWQSDGDSIVSEERFQHIVGFLADNPRVAQTREKSRERHYYDGFANYDYNKFYVAAWALAYSVPVTLRWAKTLENLYSRLHRPFDCLKDIDAAIARWQGTVGKYEPDHYRGVRSSLAAAFVKPSLSQLRSEDPARRDAFLLTFDPTSQEFRDLDWNEFIELDRNWDFALYHNMKVWSSPVARTKFRQLLWEASKTDNDISRVGLFDEKLEKMENLHPEWFVETSPYSDKPQAEMDKIDRLRSEIHQLLDSLGERRNAFVTGAGLFIVGLLIGHLI